MTKNESLTIRGIAILMMLFLHLFRHVDDYTSFIHIYGKPIEFWLLRCASPVSLYLLLSGMGLYICFKNGKCSLASNTKRTLKLYLHYWIILTLFVTIGSIIKPSVYPGGIKAIVGNYSGFNTSWNGECWFLFPYVLIVVCSYAIFTYFEKIGWRISLAVSFIISLITSYTISRHGEQYLFHNKWIYNPFLFFHLLFPFLLGATLVKTNYWNVLEKFKTYCTPILLALMIVAIIIRCLIRTSAVHIFYILFMVLVTTAIKKPKWVEFVLQKLGGQSMNMWLIHTWISTYLFHDFIFGFKYPILIIAVLTITSYSIGLLVDYIAKPIQSRLK